MEKSTHKSNKSKNCGPKQKNQTTQGLIIKCLGRKETHRITINLKVPFDEQELLQTSEW